MSSFIPSTINGMPLPPMPSVVLPLPVPVLKRRRLVTPLPELGIEFVPSQSETLEVSTLLGRSLSYLMGRTANGMRMLSCDDNGRLLISTEDNRIRQAITPTSGAVAGLTTFTDTPVAAFDYFVLVVQDSQTVVEILDDAGSVVDMLVPTVQALRGGFSLSVQYFQASRRGRALRITEFANVVGTYAAWYFISPPD